MIFLLQEPVVKWIFTTVVLDTAPQMNFCLYTTVCLNNLARIVFHIRFLLQTILNCFLQSHTALREAMGKSVFLLTD